MKSSLLCLSFIFLSLIASAQTSLYDSTKKSSLRFGLQYKSDYYYMGRSDSARVPYLTPSISYYHKSGFYLSGLLSFLTAENQNRVDLYTLSAGYAYYRKHWITGISLNQYFFNQQSYAVQAEMKTYITGYTGYDFKYFVLIADVALGVSDNYDVFLGAEISRAFYAVRDRLRITPALYINFGTQKYYSEYYTTRSLTTGSSGYGKGNGGNGGSGSIGSTTTTIPSIQTLESEKFQMLDYEASLLLSYRLKRFQFLTSATVLFPVNPSTIETDQYTYVEDLNTGFYWSVGIRYYMMLKNSWSRQTAR